MELLRVKTEDEINFKQGLALKRLKRGQNFIIYIRLNLILVIRLRTKFSKVFKSSIIFES